LNPDKVTSKNPARSAGFFVFTAVNIHIDKRKKQKYPQIAQQFWVYACYELPLGKRASLIRKTILQSVELEQRASEFK